jgi:hypothetical protein
MAGGFHLWAGDVFAFSGETFGATPSLRAPTEIEPAAGCVGSWPSQPLATASTTKRNSDHNLMRVLMRIAGLRFVCGVKVDTIGRDGRIMAAHRVESTARITKI